MGWRMNKPDVATPAGFRQAHPIHSKEPKHMLWFTRAIKGLVYMGTDKGPQRKWVWEAGKAEELSVKVGLVIYKDLVISHKILISYQD